MTTIKDIAVRAQVAPSTVSHVLNGTKYVSKEIKSKVLQAVDELGYRPNLTARSLKTKRSNIIGVMIPRFDAFFSGIMNALESSCQDKGYSIIVSCSHESKAKERRNLETLLQHGIDGLILWGVGGGCDILKRYPIPTVANSWAGPEEDAGYAGFPAVTVDNAGGAYMATSHLIDRGCRRIAFISGSMHVRDYWERSRGYDRALSEHGLPVDPVLKKHVGDEKISSAAGYVEDLIQARIPFDGIFAASDFYAYGALQMLQRHSVRVPEDVKLIGFSFHVAETADLIIPTISTITQQQKVIGEKCVDLLEEAMRSPGKYGSGSEHTVMLTPELIVRKTT